MKFVLKTSEKNPDPQRLSKRGQFVLGGIAVGAIASGTLLGEYLTHRASDNIAVAHESEKFSKSHLADHLKENNIDPASVTTYNIQLGDTNPTEVANKLHAKDTNIVKTEISGQVGGDRSMEVGETVVIPTSQLEIPTTQAKH